MSETERDLRDDMSIGELANDQLGHLTAIEELVADLANGREVYDYQIEEAVEHVEHTQKNANEILRRFEERVEPIGRHPRTGSSPSYQCPVCHKVWGSRGEAEEHVETHPGVQPSAVVVL